MYIKRHLYKYYGDNPSKPLGKMDVYFGDGVLFLELLSPKKSLKCYFSFSRVLKGLSLYNATVESCHGTDCLTQLCACVTNLSHM